MINDRSVIGEGAYGCIHKPSIKCLENPYPNFNYNEYISKLMKKGNAEKELKEFEIIQNIDKTNEYHLGMPIMCIPNTIFSKEKEDIKKCKRINQYDIKTTPENYRLLLMDYGGSDLKQFCKNYLNSYLSENSEYKVDLFWLDVHNLIKGLNVFNKNGVSHCDINPSNIVFDMTTNKCKYIDFGLMTSFEKLKELSLANNNMLSVFHWSYPLESCFMNVHNYEKYINLSNDEKNDFAEKMRQSIILNDDLLTDYEPLNIENVNSFKMLFSFLNDSQEIPPINKQIGYINSFLYGFNKIIESDNYETVLEKIIVSIDIFSLGFTLQYVLNNFMLTNKISLDFYTTMSNLFNKMYNYNFLMRVLDTESILNEYEIILLELGILSRLNKRFVNNNILDNSETQIISREGKTKLNSDTIDMLMSNNIKDLKSELLRKGGSTRVKRKYKKHQKKNKSKKRRLY